MADLSQHHAAGVRSFAFAEARDAAFAVALARAAVLPRRRGPPHARGRALAVAARPRAGQPARRALAGWRSARSTTPRCAWRSSRRCRRASAVEIDLRMDADTVADCVVHWSLLAGSGADLDHGRRLRAHRPGSRSRGRARRGRAASPARPRARVQGRRPERAQPLDGGLRRHRGAPALRAADRRRERHDHGRRGARRQPRARAAGPAGRDRPRRRARPPDGRRAAPRCPLGQRASSSRRSTRGAGRRAGARRPGSGWSERGIVAEVGSAPGRAARSRGCCRSSSTT